MRWYRNLFGRPPTATDPGVDRLSVMITSVCQALRSQRHEPERRGPTVIRTRPPGARMEGEADSRPPSQGSQREVTAAAGPVYDVVVCGGTLGVFIAATLQQRGHNVRRGCMGSSDGRREK